MSTSSRSGAVRIAALYRFQRLADPQSLRGPLFDFCAQRGIRGTLLLAREGINGTVAGDDAGIEALVEHIERDLGLAGLEVKYSRSDAMPFHRLKVRIKREIVCHWGSQAAHGNVLVRLQIARERASLSVACKKRRADRYSDYTMQAALGPRARAVRQRGSEQVYDGLGFLRS